MRRGEKVQRRGEGPVEAGEPDPSRPSVGLSSNPSSCSESDQHHHFGSLKNNTVQD